MPVSNADEHGDCEGRFVLVSDVPVSDADEHGDGDER